MAAVKNKFLNKQASAVPSQILYSYEKTNHNTIQRKWQILAKHFSRLCEPAKWAICYPREKVQSSAQGRGQ